MFMAIMLCLSVLLISIEIFELVFASVTVSALTGALDGMRQLSSKDKEELERMDGSSNIFSVELSPALLSLTFFETRAVMVLFEQRGVASR